MKTSLLTLAAAFLSGCVVYVGNGHADNLNHEQRKLTLEASALTQLIADTAAGRLELIGEDGRTEIELIADIYYYSAEDVRLSLQPSGNKAVLESGFNKGAYHGNSPYMDIVVKLPARFNLKLDDGSGDTKIHGLRGDMDIDDGSGDLTIHGGANVTIEDGSGAVSVSQLSGKLVVEDGSGDLHINQIAGDVSIDDGSGDMTITGVGGIVTIDDGSGDIRVDGAGGLNIIASGSGELKLNAINGPVNISD
jgi:hypothetical protein